MIGHTAEDAAVLLTGVTKRFGKTAAVEDFDLRVPPGALYGFIGPNGAGKTMNELREAQSLIMPIMLVIMVPWLTWMPISRDPNSTFSVAMSFIPPVNTFAMMLRMASVSPPPLWQVWLSICVGVVAVFAALWFAAKVFRIGLLMHGRPPNLATLIRWVRAA